MKWIVFVLLTAFFVILFTALFSPSGTMKRQSPSSQSNGKVTMRITSSAFVHNEKIPSKYTCDGQNINPPLQFENVPPEAKSLVLIVDDPDAPNGTWHHWSVYNINPQTTEIAEGENPESGEEGRTDFGKPGYGGPCPPSGSHRYFFKLFALDTKLKLENGATLNEIQNAMQNHIIAEAELVGVYRRSN